MASDVLCHDLRRLRPCCPRRRRCRVRPGPPSTVRGRRCSCHHQRRKSSGSLRAGWLHLEKGFDREACYYFEPRKSQALFRLETSRWLVLACVGLPAMGRARARLREAYRFVRESRLPSKASALSRWLRAFRAHGQSAELRHRTTGGAIVGRRAAPADGYYKRAGRCSSACWSGDGSDGSTGRAPSR